MSLANERTKPDKYFDEVPKKVRRIVSALHSDKSWEFIHLPEHKVYETIIVCSH